MKSTFEGRLILCRGCCCGVTTGRREGAEERLTRLRALEDLGYLVRVSDCLGPCNQGDIVVLVPGSSTISGLKKPIWFKGMHLESLHSLLVDWLKSGETSFTGVYALLSSQVFKPNKRDRKATNEDIWCNA